MWNYYRLKCGDVVTDYHFENAFRVLNGENPLDESGNPTDKYEDFVHEVLHIRHSASVIQNPGDWLVREVAKKNPLLARIIHNDIHRFRPPYDSINSHDNENH